MKRKLFFWGDRKKNCEGKDNGMYKGEENKLRQVRNESGMGGRCMRTKSLEKMGDGERLSKV